MITLSADKPMFDNYQADQSYVCALVAHDTKTYFLNLEELETSIPFLTRVVHDQYLDFYTPVGFQCRLPEGYWESVFCEMTNLLKEAGCVCLYLQTRNLLGSELNSQLTDVRRYRTNYIIDLSKNLDELIQAQARDSRSRYRKAIREIEYELYSGECSEDFFKNYERISQENRFSHDYLIEKEKFLGIINAPGIEYLEIRSNGEFVAGAIFGGYLGDVDYIFSATSELYKDASRLLIWEAVKHYKKKGYSRFYLGGGITEGDSLSNYKERLGANGQRCSTIRQVVNPGVAEMIFGKKVSNMWFEGFFPPYVTR